MKKEFYVKDTSVLKKYGFYLNNEKHCEEWWLRPKRTLQAIVRKDHTIQFFSPNKNVIAILCEMYKQGEVEIINIEENRYTYAIKVSEEEREMILKYRNELNEREVKKYERD